MIEESDCLSIQGLLFDLKQSRFENGPFHEAYNCNI